MRAERSVGRRLPVLTRPTWTEEAAPAGPAGPTLEPGLAKAAEPGLAKAAEPGLAKAAEPDDPLALVGVAVAIDEATFDEMAEVFIEEFVRDGWPDERLLAFFRSPFYAGLHVIWRRRGEAWVRDRIAAARGRWHRSPDGGRTAAEPATTSRMPAALDRGDEAAARPSIEAGEG